MKRETSLLNRCLLINSSVPHAAVSLSIKGRRWIQDEIALYRVEEMGRNNLFTALPVGDEQGEGTHK